MQGPTVQKHLERPFAGADMEGLAGASLGTEGARPPLSGRATQTLHWLCSWSGGAGQAPSHLDCSLGRPIVCYGPSGCLVEPRKRGTRGMCGSGSEPESG